MNIFYFIFASFIIPTCTTASTCICTTVSCPQIGENKLIMGDGTANIDYIYVQHGDHIVVQSATGTITASDLDHGTGTTSCTQKYSRMLDDDGIQDCDAGHILANRLGGYGNQPINIFPQDASINRGEYAQFENDIYECITEDTKEIHLDWNFIYSNNTQTKPDSVKYTAEFSGGKCSHLSSIFSN